MSYTKHTLQNGEIVTADGTVLTVEQLAKVANLT